MAAGGTDRDFKLVTPDDVVECDDGDDVTLHCHLSPETSAVAMEIRWFRETDSFIYLYKNGHVTEGRGYEGRVSVDPQELQRGGVSLRLRSSRRGDGGVYTCQVISGEHMEEGRVGLMISALIVPAGDLLGDLLGFRRLYGLYERIREHKGALKRRVRMEVTAEERKKMEESVQSLEMEASRTQLKSRDKELQELRNQLQEQQKELEEKNKILEERERYLKDKDMELVRKTQELNEKNKLLQERDRQVEHRDGELQKNITLMQEMNMKIETITQQLEEKHTELENMRKQEREQASLLENMRTQLQEQERELKEKDRQLELAKTHDDPDPPPIRRRRSKEDPPYMGRESPGPAPPVSPAVLELRLVLLGGSAAGKRAAGNTILGTHTLTHTSTETQHSESRQGEVAGRRVTLVETPDWFCSGLSEKDMRQDVGLCVRLSAPGPHAFLLVIPVEPSEGEERRMLEKMEDIFGEACWGHTLILFTHAEGLRERSVEELLQTGSQELQQLVEKCGNRCHLLSVKDRPDDTKITQLLEKIEEMGSGNRERFYSRDSAP